MICGIDLLQEDKANIINKKYKLKLSSLDIISILFILFIIVNPLIIKEKGEQEVEEGCLSFPNKYAKMIRPAEVVVEALDENGKKVTIKAKELLAQALCHEIDHLNGITFVDKMIPGTLEYVEPEKNN